MAFYDDYREVERAALYRLFAGLFMKKPTDEVLSEVKEMFRIESPETADTIGMDFDYIFSGQRGIQPYESFYNYPLGDRPGLWGKATEEVQAFYVSAGLMIDEEINLIPDHISMELLFMSYLVENEFVEEQMSFLAEHLSRWAPEYCDEIYRHASTIFYKEVANLLKEFILSECEQFDIDLSSG